jgi:hypothetical protein
MNVSNLIDSLRMLLDKHGDRPVTLGCGTYEYSVGSVGHANKGPLPNITGIQEQGDLPERIVIEGKMQG